MDRRQQLSVGTADLLKKKIPLVLSPKKPILGLICSIERICGSKCLSAQPSARVIPLPAGAGLTPARKTHRPSQAAACTGAQRKYPRATALACAPRILPVECPFLPDVLILRNTQKIGAVWGGL